jgi:hypothetical protein
MPFADKEKRKEYDRLKYQRNREKILAQRKIYGQEHKEQIAKYHREWKSKNRLKENARIRAWKKKNIVGERKKRYDEVAKAWRKKNSDKVVAKVMRQKAKNPMAYWARICVNAAVNCGAISRPPVCSKCGNPCKPQAHHSDYAKPLEVIWLCHACHLEVHHGNFNAHPTASLLITPGSAPNQAE